MTSMEAFLGEVARLRARPARATRRRPLLTVLAVAAARLVVATSRARTAAMSVAGFGCLTMAAWTVSTSLGLAAAGVSLLVLEYLTNDGGGRRR